MKKFLLSMLLIPALCFAKATPEVRLVDSAQAVLGEMFEMLGDDKQGQLERLRAIKRMCQNEYSQDKDARRECLSFFILCYQSNKSEKAMIELFKAHNDFINS
jgi:hypothetical protein